MRIALDQGHARHGQAGRIQAVEARGNDDVADLDVGAGGREAQLHGAGLAAPDGHAAHAIAQQLHGNGLLFIGQERHFGGEREHARDLSHHAQVVDHGAAQLHAMLDAPVEHDLARGRIARVVQHFGHHGLDGHALARFHQLAQVVVFNDVELRLLQDLRRGDLFVFQVAHLFFQGGQRREVVADTNRHIARHQGCHLHRIQHGADGLAHGRQRVHARIDQQQGD
ncbi:hypothetical protein JANLI_11350 [Janthinobacterium lividum]|nr:hypothetical protein JANLI_11350 [Janthinobacterium lividum]